jgi:hypothetical protein
MNHVFFRCFSSEYILYLKKHDFKECSNATYKKIKILNRRSRLFFASCKMEHTGTDHLFQEYLLKPKLRGGGSGGGVRAGGGGVPPWFSPFCPRQDLSSVFKGTVSQDFQFFTMGQFPPSLCQSY